MFENTYNKAKSNLCVACPSSMHFYSKHLNEKTFDIIYFLTILFCNTRANKIPCNTTTMLLFYFYVFHMDRQLVRMLTFT